MKRPKGLSVVDPAFRDMVKATKDVVRELKKKYGTKAGMKRLKTVTTENGQKFELFRNDEGDYFLLAAGSSQYVGPLSTEARAEDEADFLSIL